MIIRQQENLNTVCLLRLQLNYEKVVKKALDKAEQEAKV